MAVVIFWFLFARPASAQCSGPATVAELGESLWGDGSGYDRMTRPALAARGGSGALADNVSVQLQLFALQGVDAVSQTFTVEVYVRVRWHDERLQYVGSDSGGCFPGGSAGYLGMDVADFHNVWVPDVVFQNLAEEETTLQNAWFLAPDGSIIWSRKAILTFTCAMDFTELPYDTQRCPMLLFPWRDLITDCSAHFDDPAVIMSYFGGSVEWMINEVEYKIEDDPSIWGCLGHCIGVVWTVIFTRRPGYYVRWILLPNIIFVLIAWCSFWVSRATAPARIALGIICFLAARAQINSVMASLPKYDGQVWLLTQLSISQCFVLYAVLEYVVCNVLMRIQGRLANSQATCEPHPVKDQEALVPRPVALGQQLGEQESPRTQACTEATPSSVSQRSCWLRLCVSRAGHMRFPAHVLENISRVLFPIMYIIVSVTAAVVLSTG